jgi:hypothetical protein
MLRNGQRIEGSTAPTTGAANQGLENFWSSGNSAWVAQAYDRTAGAYINYKVFSLAGSFVDQSDQRLKTDINALSNANGLDAIMALRPVSFRWKDQATDRQKGEQIGFLAQDLEKVFPKLVSVGIATTTAHLADGSVVTVADPKFVNYEGLIVPAVKAIQDLNLKLEDLGTSTATTTDATSFTSRFFSSLFTRITAWLADAQNGITDFFAKVGTFGRVNTEELCVDDVCVTRDEFLRMKEAQSAAAGAPGAGNGATDGAPTSGEHAVHLDVDAPNVTEDGDDNATTSPQVIVPPSISAPTTSNPTAKTPADETPDTQLVEAPPEPAVAAPEPELTPANDNPPLDVSEPAATGIE